MTDLGIRGFSVGNRMTEPVQADGSLQRAAFRLRQMGDRYRDRRNWQQAREHYRRYLEIVPRDAPIWIQYGHSCKEIGDVEAAEDAYRNSLDLAPSSDAYLSLGRMLKSRGDIAAAGAAFRRAAELEAGFDLGAGLNNGKTEIAGTPVPRSGAATLPKRVLIDLSDIIVYLGDNTTVSGIQRVQLGLAETLLRLLPELPYTLAFVCGLTDGSGWLEIDNSYLKTLVKKISAPVVDQEELRDLISRIEDDAAPYEPAEGDLFLILGAFWVIEHLVDQISELQRKGARIGVLVHDLIPITHPEFCAKELRATFELCCDCIFRVADFMLTVSDYTAEAVRQVLQQREFLTQSIATLRLAHRTVSEASQGGPPRSMIGARLTRQPYILYVSTIEARKNHRYLFQIWKRLQTELGKDTPRLIFVGKIGWLADDLMRELESSEFLGGHIKVVSGISDPDLSELYRNCLFTVFPSFEEGWGLPIGESLMFGRPCLASQTSSLPEVAGEFVDYFDPFNVTDGYEKIKKFILDEEIREARAAAIKAGFCPRLWSDVANDLLRTIEEHASERRISCSLLEPPALQPGVVYAIGHGGDVSGFVRSGRAAFVRAICGENWYGLEEWGRWMRGHFAALRFRLAEHDPYEIVLLLELQTVEGFRGPVRIGIGEGLYKDLALKAGSIERFMIRTTPAGPTVRIDIESRDQLHVGNDPRPLNVGIRSIAYAPANDLVARVSLLETLNIRICDFRPSDAPVTHVSSRLGAPPGNCIT